MNCRGGLTIVMQWTLRQTLILLAAAWLCSIASTAHAQTPSPSTESRDSAPSQGAPVIWNGSQLFVIPAPLGSLTAEDRAGAIAERLARLAQDPLSASAGVAVNHGEHFSEIVAGTTVIATVTDADAQALGRPRVQLAAHYAEIVRGAVGPLPGGFDLHTILVDTGYVLSATAVFVALLLALGRLFPKVYERIRAWKGVYIRSIRIQRVEVLSADKLVEQVVMAARVLRGLLTLVLTYLYLTTVLGVFDLTRGLAEKLVAAVLATLHVIGTAFIGYIPDLVSIAVIVFVTRYLIKLIHLVFNGIERGAIRFPGFYREWAQPTYQIVRFLVIAFATIAIFPYIPGSRSEAFRGVSVFLGILFSLSSAGAISNVVAGVILTYMRPFQLGDRVKIADTVGDIIEKTLLVTRVRTIKNVDITIPNSLILGAHIINFSSSSFNPPPLILHTSVTIGYDAPWRTVHELLKKAAAATPHILKTPEPFVLQTALNDFYVSYEINAYTDEPNLMATIYSDLHQQIQDTFNEAGVEIMSPHYTQVRDGNKTTIPEEYLPKSYQAPAFRILPFDVLKTPPGASRDQAP